MIIHFAFVIVGLPVIGYPLNGFKEPGYRGINHSPLRSLWLQDDSPGGKVWPILLTI